MPIFYINEIQTDLCLANLQVHVIFIAQWYQHPPVARVVPDSSFGMQNKEFFYGYIALYQKYSKINETLSWNVPVGDFGVSP